jgi:release factor glutamine methyltransferase
MTFQEAINYGSDILSNRFEAEIIFCHVVNIARSYLYAHQEEELKPFLWQEYQRQIEKRKQGLPIAYITGCKEFWSLDFEVNQHTLIPRPESELLVQLTLEELSTKQNVNILELGVGSGAVAIAIAHERPQWQIIGTDISKDALAIAQKNADRHQIKNLKLYESNWFQNVPAIEFDIIISNPPYIAANDPHLTELNFEPQSALVSGEDGLDDIKIIIKDALAYLKENGQLLLEHGYNQGSQVCSLMKQNYYQDVKTIKDYNNIERVTTGAKGINNEDCNS